MMKNSINSFFRVVVSKLGSKPPFFFICQPGKKGLASYLNIIKRGFCARVQLAEERRRRIRGHLDDIFTLKNEKNPHLLPLVKKPPSRRMNLISTKNSLLKAKKKG